MRRVSAFTPIVVFAASIICAVTTLAASQVPGRDLSFMPTISNNAGPNDWVDFSLTTGFPDDRFIISGRYAVVNEVPAVDSVVFTANGSVDSNYPLPINRPIIHILPDGSYYASEGGSVGRYSREGVRDPTFATLPTSGSVDEWFELTNGQKLASGAFFQLADGRQTRFARVNADGSIDPNWLPDRSVAKFLAPEPDGGAILYHYHGLQPPNGIVRVFPDGTDDPGFALVQVANYVSLVSRQLDDSYIILGSFESVNGEPRNNFARILSDGTLAANFTGLDTPLRLLATKSFEGGVLQFAGVPYDRLPHELHNLSQEKVVVGRVHPDGNVEAIEIMVPHRYDRPHAIIQENGKTLFVGDSSNGHMTRVNPDGTFDPTFQGSFGFTGSIAAVPGPGGTILVGDDSSVYNNPDFNRVNGQPYTTLVLLDSQGGTVERFESALPRADALEFIMLPDRSVIANYGIHNTKGALNETMTRLFPDGSEDVSFKNRYSRGNGFLLTKRGKLYARVVAVPGSEYRLRRFNCDLSIDTSFDVDSSSPVVAEMPDEKILVLGNATDLNGVSRSGLIRLHPNGFIDTAFDPIEIDGQIMDVTATANGKIVVVGEFDSVDGSIDRQGVVRLNNDGSLDESFMPPAFSDPAGAARLIKCAVEADGSVIAHGNYPRGDGVITSQLVRFHPDGVRDTSFSYEPGWVPGATANQNIVDSLWVDDTGDIYVAGSFRAINARVPAASIFRLSNKPFQVHPRYSHESVPEGGTAYLEVVTTGVERIGPQPAVYQWFFNDVAIPLETKPILNLRNFDASRAGVYRMEATWGGDTVSSGPISVELSSETITQQLTPLTFSAGGGVGGVRVNAPTGTSWSVDDVPYWILAQADGTGTGTVSFLVAPNESGAERTAAITIAGIEYHVSQSVDSSRLISLSTRGWVGGGADDLMIVGFSVAGAPAEVMSRAVGPSLEQFGVVEFLDDPRLTLLNGTTVTGNNDQWDTGPDRDLIVSESEKVGAFVLADGSADAVLLSELSPGLFTAHMSGRPGEIGVGLAEFYLRNPDPMTWGPERAVSISTRGFVGFGEHVMIAGFSIAGTARKQVLIRGIGPGLEAHGVEGFLLDPVIQLFDGNTLLAENDDWNQTALEDVIKTASEKTGAFEMTMGSEDAAIVATLDPGVYTVILYGTNFHTGVGLIEVYDLE